MIFGKRYKHKLITIGDSLTQGFQNSAIHRTDINYPSFLMEALQPKGRFCQPTFYEQGGIPLNLETLLCGIEEFKKGEVDWNGSIEVANHIYSTLRRIKKFWDGNPKLRVYPKEPWHNQSIWGLGLSDLFNFTDNYCETFLKNNPPQKSAMELLVSYPKHLTGRRVLNPGFKPEFSDRTMLKNIEDLAANGGIENLIFFMGANNILGTVVDFRFVWSEKEQLGLQPHERTYTILRPDHFELLYRKSAKFLSTLNIKQIFTSTIPYVSIPPITRGINTIPNLKSSGYFDYYTRFWIWDNQFNPEIHPYLTKKQVIELDITIDSYNKIIKEVANDFDWRVAPFNTIVRKMAVRRRGYRLSFKYPDGLKLALKNNPRTNYLVDSQDIVQLTTHFLRTDKESGKIIRGGIFSLDGLHPTTTAYGLMAHMFKEVMRQSGVRFEQDINWDRIVSEDRLLTHPPKLLGHLEIVLNYLSIGYQSLFKHLSSNILHELTKLLGTGHT